MKHSAWLLSAALLAGLVFFTGLKTPPVSHHSESGRPQQIEMDSPCLGENEILTNLRSLSSEQSLPQQESAKRNLIEDANKSRAMDKPLAELRNDRSSFYLWHYGSEILATLKAEESLDLLIENFELDDGTSFPLNHHPAVVNVIRMGSIAVPKLGAVLRQSNDPNSRHYAVFCIASIGGPDARTVLLEALPSESNTCVRSFIKASLEALDGATLQIASDRRTRWYGAFLCNIPE